MKILSVIILFILTMLTSMASEQEEKIIQFINLELKHYPEARLTDLYKNYFQDAFGPGHLIPDTTRAGAYLDREIKEAVWKDTLQWQALGIHNNYYRINLLLIRDNIIPRNILLQGMVESAPLARKPDINCWKAEWAEVLMVIKKNYPTLPYLLEDEKTIEALLNKGEVVMHHSQHYGNTYEPHYRIIHRTVFERWISLYFK